MLGHRILWSAAAILASAWALATAAQSPRAEEIRDLETPVFRGSKTTYLDLVRSVFKNLREDEDGGWVTSEERVLRRVGEKERTVVPEGTPLTAFYEARTRGDGRTYLLLCVEAQGDFSPVPADGATVLAVFPEGSGEPTDVADVAQDRFTSLDFDLPALGPDGAFAVQNSHHNSNQGYLITDLFHIREGRLRLITSVFTLSLHGMCQRSFRETLSFATREVPGLPYPEVIATVALERGPSEDERESCPGAGRGAHRKEYRQTCRWDRARGRYGPPDRGLVPLDRFNRKSV